MENFINLTVSSDNMAYNNTVQTSPHYQNVGYIPTPTTRSQCVEEVSSEYTRKDNHFGVYLSDFSNELITQLINDVDFDITSSISNIINDIITEDKDQIKNYFLELNFRIDTDVDGTSKTYHINGSIDNRLLENGMIKTFNFNLNITKDNISAYIPALYINKRYSGAGSKLLNIIKKAVKSILSIDSQKHKGGSIELYSVETAVMFYIKNGFIIKDIFNLKDPLQKANTLFRIMEFSIREDNVDLLKKFAAIDVSKPEKFQEFIDWVFQNTKYGKFFTAYSEIAGESGEIEASILRSKFISSLFPTNMIQVHRPTPKSKLMQIKPLTQ